MTYKMIMTYKIMMRSWGGTEKVLVSGLTREEAFDICQGYDWMWESPEGGYIWDLFIETE